MSRDRPEEYSIRYWLKAINRSLEKLIVESLDRFTASHRPPEVDEIHYADGRIVPLADLISAVERTIEPRGTMVGGIFIPEQTPRRIPKRPETTD